MGYGNRGNYGRGQGGGRSNYSNRGGGRGGYNRGGGNRSGGGSNDGGDDFKYVRSSYLSKFLIFEAEAREGEKPPREQQSIEPGVTEEVTIVLAPQKTEALMRKIQDAQNDPDGDGGIVLKAYLQHKINRNDNSEYDGASILVLGKFPPRGGNGHSGNSSRGNGGRNGRRDYPERQEDSRQASRQAEDRRDNEPQGGPPADDVPYTENAGW